MDEASEEIKPLPRETTVGALIERLQKFHPDEPVFLHGDYGYDAQLQVGDIPVVDTCR